MRKVIVPNPEGYYKASLFEKNPRRVVVIQEASYSKHVCRSQAGKSEGGGKAGWGGGGV